MKDKHAIVGCGSLSVTEDHPLPALGAGECKPVVIYFSVWLIPSESNGINKGLI